MQQKPDVTPKTATGIPAEIVHVPAIIETRGLGSIDIPLRMDPRVQSRILDAVSILQSDYAEKLLNQIAILERQCTAWQSGSDTAESGAYAIAHEIRSIAGTFARPLAGEIAARICHLIELFDEDSNLAIIDIVQQHVETLSHLSQLTPEPQGISATVLRARLDEISPECVSLQHSHAR